MPNRSQLIGGIKDRLRAATIMVKKVLIDRKKYKRGDGYDAEAYWNDRFKRYGESMRGVGKESLSETKNRAAYTEAVRQLDMAMNDTGINPEGKRILEIGPGNGYFTNHFYPMASQYVAMDITDVLFDNLRGRFPEAEFLKGNICSTCPPGRYDLVLMIDVIEHIVTEEELARAFTNVRESLDENACFIVGPVFQESKKHLYYVHFWNVDEIHQFFPDHTIMKYEPFKNGSLFIVQTISSSDAT